MSKKPSEFLEFLKKNAQTKDGNLFLTIKISPVESLDRLIAVARQNEAKKEATEPNGIVTALESCRGEAKKGLANLKDKREALQVIIAITDKELGE